MFSKKSSECDVSDAGGAGDDGALGRAAWARLRRAVPAEALRILGITPFEKPDVALAGAFVRQGAVAAVDIGRVAAAWPALFSAIEGAGCASCGLRFPDHLDVVLRPEDVPASTPFVVLGTGHDVRVWSARFPVLFQATSVAEAAAALADGAAGLIAKGQESAGSVGDESGFILLQRLLVLAEPAGLPVWCQGGMGLHTAAGAIAGGAFGVVLDSQLALLPECALAEEIRAAIRVMDGSETRVVGGYSLYARPGPGLPAAGQAVGMAAEVEVDADAVRAALTAGTLLAVGQDAALARPLAEQCGNVETLLHAFRMNVAGHLRQVAALRPLDALGPLAVAHATRYPVFQGPMTRVSDTAAFACAVAENGALPFLALSLMEEAPARRLLDETRAAIGTRSWGVGVLGFAPPEILDPQLALIRAFRPTAVLLAGGRPAQARALAEEGIPAYLHVPSPGLLSLFLKDGARHFVFEGRECGGHVGPRFSFVLWEQQIRILLDFERPEDLHLLFAGGIHDARSAAMVATLAAPLAARGAKIGVLMGTAYLATPEAVACGAINGNFQRKALGAETTVLLESAPGHATRCLDTAFVAQFNAEKKRMQAAGMALPEIARALEDLNIGRLRIASKGVQRCGDALCAVDAATQEADGMYMIGQLAALRRTPVSMAELHDVVSRGAMDFLARAVSGRSMGLTERPARSRYAEPVAIVGMACIYPGSPDLESFWANIVEGRNLVGEVPPERWNVDLYYRQGAAGNGKSPSKWGGFIGEVAFDPLRYGIPPQSLAAIEPVQLLSLEVASQALADAGYGDGGRSFDREKVAVIFGAESGTDLSQAYTLRNLYPQYLGDLPAELDAALPGLTEDSFPGVLVNVISGRIANRLGLGGVNYSVDSACASSLTAVELAIKELRSGASDMVLAGGADFHNSIHDFLMFASVKALSPTGLCRSFDDAADGICLGEGVGVAVLKRLSDAERDGDRIYAVIDGVAGSSDGKGLGLTAPRKEGQKRALERAYAQAGVLPGEVGLVEAHGTGTVVGDRTELQTLTEIFNAGGALPLQTALGSVKSQIGHTKCAAGMAGLIKVAKALHHRVLPPTLHIARPNAGYDAVSSPFMLNATARPWPVRQDRSRGAVSAFGFGGANFHAVLSAHVPTHPSSAANVCDVTSGMPQWSAELFLIRGASFADAASSMQRALAFLRESDAPLRLRDLAFTLCGAAGGGHGPVHCAFVAGDIADLRAKLECACAHQAHREIHYRAVDGDADVADAMDIAAGKLALVFPGQGSQTPGMLRDIFILFPWLHAVLDAGGAWVDRIFPPTVYTPEQQRQQQRALTDTRVAQPALGVADYAMAMLLQALGLRPDALAGHSYGELVALSVAGCFDLPALLRLSRQRGEAILAAAGDDPGGMAAVAAGVEKLAQVLGADARVVAANQNAPEQTVISGATPAIAEALLAIKAQGIAAQSLEVACAFHSPLIAGAEALFAARLDGLAVAAPAVAVYANRTAAPYPAEGEEIRRQMAAQIVSPVRFVAQIERMYADGVRVFVESGPGAVLTGLISRILAGRPHLAIATDRKGQPGLPALLQALARLSVAREEGHGIDPAPLWRGRAPQSLDFAKPRMLPATCWMVDGGCARPRQGTLPRHAGQTPAQPLACTSQGCVAPGEQAVLHYLNNMCDLVQAQRDIMLTMLGGTSTIATAAVSKGLLPDVATGAPRAAVVPVVPDLRRTLLSIVSERTGYPEEMLDPDLDLEADLSIDSIKRVEIVGELAERIGLYRQPGGDMDALLERLAAQKTIRSMADCLEEILPVAGSSAAVVPGVAPVPAVVVPVATVDARAVLWAIVSERTGYPEAVLEADLDLEADLSIDSIKRLEIVGELAERLGLEHLLADKDAAMETLAALKTLRAMLDWLNDHDSGGRVAEGAPGDGVAAAAPASTALLRHVPRVVAAPHLAGDGNAPDISGRHFLITDDGRGVAEALAARLRTRGAAARIADFSEHAVSPDDLARCDGLIHLFALHPASRVRDVKRFAVLLREMLAQEKMAHLLVASGLGGNLGQGVPLQDFGHGAGMAGLLKSVAREWPALRVHCVDVDPDAEPDTLAACLESELLAADPLTEVAWRNGRRQRVEFALAPLVAAEAGTSSALALDENSVVFLTGGARGITAQLAVELARRFRCHIELAGRSPMPGPADTQDDITGNDPVSLRKALIGRHPELKPAEVERRCAQILVAREMRQTLAGITMAGGKVRYAALDVRDLEALASHIAALYRHHGRLDGVVHGAGVVEDKLLRDKTPESFARVFDTKLRGALTINNLVREDVRFVVFFSSVSGAFGNKGQTDYAAANDALDRIARALQARVAGRVVSIDWGPWVGAGMISAALEREYVRRGIGLIPLREGIDALLQELCCGARDETQVVWMCATPESFGRAG